MYSSDDGNDAFDIGSPAFIDLTPMAYVRPVATDNGTAFGVYASDGTQLALFASREAAYFAAKQHNLEPVLLH